MQTHPSKASRWVTKLTKQLLMLITCCFFLTYPHTTIPNFMRDFDIYGYVSNLEINYSKLEALNLTLPQETIVLLKVNCHFKWEPQDLKYLGVWLTLSFSALFENQLIRIWRPGRRHFFHGLAMPPFLKCQSFLSYYIYFMLHQLLFQTAFSASKDPYESNVCGHTNH